MKKILFLIHDLDHGGAEKVLVNLVNNMDRTKFDITVLALFGDGVNEQFLDRNIKYMTVFDKMLPANSHWMKLFSPKQLHKWFIKEHYDIEIAYLEGPAVRIISGCLDKNTKLISWIHCTMHSKKEFSIGFRSYKEAQKCIGHFNNNVFVSQGVKEAFEKYCDIKNSVVLYNTNESDKIIAMADEVVDKGLFCDNGIKLIGVGKIEEVKGFERLAHVHKKLIEDGYPVHTYILGEGKKQEEITLFLENEGIKNSFHFLGYQTNPYKFMKNSDIFVCSSYSEGFSTATTEALIVGTPVVTTLVSGMKELLGNGNEWGIVTENSEEALYKGIKQLLDDPNMYLYYKDRAVERGKTFSKENTVRAVEKMLLSLSGDQL